MISARKKKLQSRELFSQLDEFDKDVFFGDRMGSDRRRTEVESAQFDSKFISTNNSGTILTNDKVDLGKKPDRQGCEGDGKYR